ncbi:MAG TPA: ATP-dependent DNA helicase [Ktedonobacterales bacterium]|nr:ATP-dependent DNA helicase [Ktedonobacterales bacterium]
MSISLSLAEQVRHDLTRGGALSESLPDYEERAAQVEMAELVAQALENSNHAVIEASTGTGKSLAYLLPIVRSGKVAIISTANKNLQEQLFYKDIPFVQQHIQDFRAALIKGMGNYLCLDRFDKENSDLLPFQRSPAFDRLLRFLQDTVTGGPGDDDSFNGDLDTAPFTLPGDIRARIAADSDQCAWSKCNWFGDCYVREMRQRAREAQIIVVNHTLLLLDAAMDGWLLPERDVVVIDEAHHLEEEATRAFTVTVSPGRVQSLFQQRRLKEHVDPLLFQEAGQHNVVAWDRLATIADPGFKNRALLTQPFQEGLHLAESVDSLAEEMKYRRPDGMDDKEEQLYDKLIKRARTLASDLRVAFAVQDLKSRVYYVEREGGPRGQDKGLRQLSVSAAPLSITELLQTQLFEKINTIATSATLAVGGDFGYFRRRVGVLNKVVERVLPPTFDYPNHALLYLPRGLPEPKFGADNRVYIDALAREMAQLVRASRGRAFLLFSSHKAMMDVYEQLRDMVDFPTLLQGDFSRIELIKRFRSTPNAVLLGLKSFWEGVDIAGEALSLVVIDKLPFDPPDDPVHEARVKLMKEANEDWFNNYVLPQATLRLKQGLGRLIRTKEDRGVMAILDARLYTKYYGSRVVAALPPAKKTMKIEDVERFFADEATAQK